jgi:hypothetical protein
MSTEPQTFKLYGPTGELIMHGALSQVMETLPDTKARSAALADMLKVAADSVAAEERADEARASAAQILSDGVLHLMHRLDSFEKHRALSAKRAEAERQRRDRQRVEAYKDTWPTRMTSLMLSIAKSEHLLTKTPRALSRPLLIPQGRPLQMKVLKTLMRWARSMIPSQSRSPVVDFILHTPASHSPPAFPLIQTESE